MPVSQWVSKGTTGMLYSDAYPYPPNDVLSFIIRQASSYPPYQKDIWDCEDHAFLAAADIRCRFPGQPVGVAVGKANWPPELKGKMHAVDIIWFMNQENGQLKCDKFEFFDATLPIPSFIPKEYGFNIEAVIPLPVSGLQNHKDCPPVAGLPFCSKAAFQLDQRSYKFELMVDVQKTLDKQTIRCATPQKKEYESDKIWDSLFKRKVLWSIRDYPFYAFAQIRKEHMGAPVGIAFGPATAANGQTEDYAALVLWENANKYKYWDYLRKKELKDFGLTFNPRIVIV